MKVGTLEHYLENRDLYLTRKEAAARIRKTDRTLRNYVAGGLPVHEVLPGVERIFLDELLAVWRSKLIAAKGTRFGESAV